MPANAVDLELMGVLETTMVTRERRPPRDLVRRARQAPRDGYFLGGTSQLVGVVDVGMARMLHVYPLPARRERADGVVEVIEYVPPRQPAAPPTIDHGRRIRGELREAVATRHRTASRCRPGSRPGRTRCST